MEKRLCLLILLLLFFIGMGCQDIRNINTPEAVEILDIGFIVAGDRPTYHRGAGIAISEINEKGGLLGKPVGLLVHINEKGLVDVSLEITEKLIHEDHVIGIIGPNRSSHAVEVGKLASRYEVPMITTTATNPTVTESGDFVFMASFTDRFQGGVMARFAAIELDMNTAALLTRRGDVYSEGISQIFATQFRKHGGQIVAQAFYDGDTQDFTQQLNTITAKHPDVLFIPGFVPDLVLATAQARALSLENDAGIPTVFIGADTWDNTLLLESENAEIEGSYFSGHFSADTDDPTARAFVQTYESLYGVPPTGGVGVCYDAVKLLAAAIKRAGSLDPEQIRQQLARTHNYIGATRLAGFDENRHPKKSAVIFTINKGEKQFYQQINPDR